MTSPSLEARPRAPWVERALALGGAVAAAVVVFRGALATFFSQDDFAGLGRTVGLLPRLEGPWRYLSGQVYFDFMRAAAGLNPFGYHLASLLAHGVTVILLGVFLARRVGAPAAWLGAVFYATHPAHYTALYSVSGIGEILSAAFGLATLLAVGSSGRRRWLAPPLFALSLISKETTVLLPLVAALPPVHREGERSARPLDRLRDPVFLSLAAISVLYVVSFVSRDAFGIRRELPEHAAYSLAFDHTLGLTLLTYLGWTFNLFLPWVLRFSDVIDPSVFPWGIALALLWLAGATRRGLRERGWWTAGALYLALLLPVLPLRNHTYHYYLYAPVAGAAWCLAALADAFRGKPKARVASRGRGRGRAPERGPAPRGARVAWAVSLTLGTLLTLNAALLVRKIETVPFLLPELRADPTVDRARIAANVHHDLRLATLPNETRLRFWSPASIELQRGTGRDPQAESYFERNVRGALMDGLAVRVLDPRIREVEFVRAFPGFDKSWVYALYRPDGHLRIVTAAEADSLAPAFSTGP